MKCLILALFISQSVKCMESVYMKRSEIEDQESSASGYAYQLHSGVPLNYPTTAGVSHFAYPPLGLGHYPQELPLQLPEYKPPTPLGAVSLNSYGLQPLPAAYGIHYPLQTHTQISPAPVPVPVPVSVQDSSSFVKGGGSSFSDSNKNAHGEKGSSGYQTSQGFEKGAEGKHDNQGHKEHYSKEGGHKNAHHDSGSHYNQKQEAAKGSEGSSFGQSSSHKKGSKTTGFHRVHHKDEYKKDHSFYDESDSSGHFNKHADFDSQHAAKKGGFEKGGHEDGAYQAGEQGVKGFVDNGKYVGQNSGFKGEQGKEGHYKDFQEYAKKGEQQQGKEQGFYKKDVLQALQ